MYEHILISSDGSQVAQAGVEKGLQLASQHGGRVTCVTVTEPMGGQFAYAADLWAPSQDQMDDFDRSQVEIAERILAPVRARADELGVEMDTVHVPRRLVSGGILSAADECGATLIVMASHGRTGLSRVALGSQTSAVLNAAKVPVLVVR